MTRPPTTTMLLGHPLVAVPLYGLAGLLLYAWATLQTVEAGIFGIVAIVIAGRVVAANERRLAYLAWKRAWDGMAADAPEQRGRRRANRTGIAAGVAIVVMVLVARAQPDAPLVQTLPGLTLVAAVLGFAWLFVRRIRKQLRHGSIRQTRDFTVVVRAKQLMPVPTMREAYAALPPHCQRLLQPRPTDARPARR